MATGTLKMWNADRGYGFIADDFGGAGPYHCTAARSDTCQVLMGDFSRVLIPKPAGDRVAKGRRPLIEQPRIKGNQPGLAELRKVRWEQAIVCGDIMLHARPNVLALQGFR
jgi:hypothetical protein